MARVCPPGCGLAAAQIGKDIHRAAEKLAKLTKLAKSKSLFDDPAAEISELSYVITQDINRLNEGRARTHTHTHAHREERPATSCMH